VDFGREMKKPERLLAFLLARRARNRRLPVADRFVHFRAIGAANDAFLQQLSRLQERYEESSSLGMDLATTAESLKTQVRSMVHSLLAMTGNTYESLQQRFETLDREIDRLVPKARLTNAGPLIVWPQDPEALDPQVVGPKAARLAEVAFKTGLKVPPFFSISAFAYKLLMESAGLQNRIHATLASLDFCDAGSLRKFSRSMLETFDSIPVPSAIQEALFSAYRKLAEAHPGISGVAVRSSAVVEDSASSFAGQFESVLNVLEHRLPEAYKAVIASKYHEEVLRYSAARSFVEEDIAMPVLVMAMVNPAASGVAYSRSPYRPEGAMITAVRGLAQAMDSDRVVPDVFMVSTKAPEQVEISPGKRAFSLHCSADGGLEKLEEDSGPFRTPALQKREVVGIVRAARILEQHFGCPQDIEWAIDDAGSLNVVQTRPLHVYYKESRHVGREIEGYRILARGARACGGVASGFVAPLFNVHAPESVPDGAILCIPATTPRLAGVMSKVRAIVAAGGSPTGHMATVAREFEVPCLVGVETVFSALSPGMLVTVDGDAGIVYEGEVGELLQSRGEVGHIPAQRDPIRENLRFFLENITPLTLAEPEAPSFTPENCRTLHDIARFVHQKSMTAMFDMEHLSPNERRTAHRLLWRSPMEVKLLDLGGGLASTAGRDIPMTDIRSAPLFALLEGMTDPRLRWSGPVGFDLKGFMSVVVRSAADDQRYGEPNYCLCAQDYVHFASRLAYHFATVDSICGQLINENYARFLFFGGAAVATRREWRAHFLAMVLRENGFNVKQTGDRVEGMLAKRSSEKIEESLVMLGRLMVASRHLDMVLESKAAADSLAVAFLSGDYAFERVRRIGG
jgi:pyruvate,water dikinase